MSKLFVKERRVEEWLRLEACLFGRDEEVPNPGGIGMMIRRNPGCSDVRGLRLSMGLGHVGAELKKALENYVRGPLRLRVTDAMRALATAERAAVEMAGSDILERRAALMRVREDPAHAEGVADRHAYDRADAAMLNEVIPVAIYQMEATRVIPGWASARDTDAVDVPALEIPMVHLATLFEFEILIDTLSNAEE